MSLFYGSLKPVSSNTSLISPQNCSNSNASAIVRGARDGTHRSNDAERALGIFTKSQANVLPQGFQRIQDFLLQDQSAKLLPKERVSNCLKKRIDKTKHREVKYNENRKKAHYANVQRCGSIWSCPVS